MNDIQWLMIVFYILIIENFNERVIYIACNFLIFKLPDIFRKLNSIGVQILLRRTV